MKCSNCRAPLAVENYRTKEYRDDAGRVYKTRRSPTYRKCPCRDRIAAIKALHCIQCYDVVRSAPKQAPCGCRCHR